MMRRIETWSSYPPADQIFSLIRQKEEAVFLDSSSRGELGQYSIIASRPYLRLEQQDGVCRVNGSPSRIPFLAFLKQYLSENQEENETELPLVSGAVGYFSYDFGREKEGIPSRHEKEEKLPEAVMVFYDLFLIEDHRKHRLSLIANGHTEAAETGIAALRELLEAAAEDSGEGALSRKEFGLGRISADFTEESYQEALDHMIQYITDGDIYVVNMTQQLRISSPCPPYTMFCRLRQQNPSPFGAYLDYGKFQVVCASPERFLRMRNGKISTRPIKGTRKRGSTPEEDARLKEELAQSEKDQSELLMIVDLERNDLNRVCVPGTVQVKELFQVETYATVFHLVADVEGQIRPEKSAVDLLEAAFPGGSITGAPKRRAMELIDQEEYRRRGLYTGSIGYLSLDGDCDFNIVIRTAVCQDGIYTLGAGGGITCESDTAFEYEETWQKAKALLDVLNCRRREGEGYEYTVG
jgi:para-aminobenzoate synthetase component 1